MTITVKVGEETKKEMIDFFEDLKREKTPDYALFQAVDGDTVVTLYNSGKAVLTISVCIKFSLLSHI